MVVWSNLSWIWLQVFVHLEQYFWCIVQNKALDANCDFAGPPTAETVFKLYTLLNFCVTLWAPQRPFLSPVQQQQPAPPSPPPQQQQQQQDQLPQQASIPNFSNFSIKNDVNQWFLQQTNTLLQVNLDVAMAFATNGNFGHTKRMQLNLFFQKFDDKI